MATAVCMLAYHLRPRVKQLFGALNAQQSQGIDLPASH
jgi:hypothetical protein